MAEMTPAEQPLRPSDVITLWPEFDGHLMPRQAEALALFVDGHDHKEIALAMGISTKTVESHLRSIREVLGLPHRRSLASMLLRSLVRRLLRGQLAAR